MPLTVENCPTCEKIGTSHTVRQCHNGTWPDTELGLVDLNNFKICPLCGTCYVTRFHSGGMFSDDEIEFSRLSPQESEIARRLTGKEPPDLERLEALIKENRTVYFLASQIQVDLKPLVPLILKWLPAGNWDDGPPNEIITGWLLTILRLANLDGADLAAATAVLKPRLPSLSEANARLARKIIKDDRV